MPFLRLCLVWLFSWRCVCKERSACCKKSNDCKELFFHGSNSIVAVELSV